MTVFEELGMSPKEVSLEAFINIGRALGHNNDLVVIGRDSCPDGPMVFSALASGIVSVGCDVRNIGIASAPTLALACKGRGVGIGISLPTDEDEGVSMRPFNKDGTMFDTIQLSAMRDFMSRPPVLPPYDHIGSVSEQSGALIQHRNRIMGAVGNADCPVVLDCSSNSASLIAPAMLSEMGCDVVAINSQPNGRASVMQRDIDEGSLRDLIDIVHSNAGEIGIAINGDGTKVSAVDESGRYLGGETLLALIAEHLNPKKVAIPVTASMMIEDLIDGEVIRTPVGDRRIGEAMKKNDADLGGSPCGSFIFPQVTYCPDGIYAAALIAKIAGEGRLKEMVDSLPQYYKGDESIKYEGREADIAKKIAERIASSEYVKLVDIDGWRVEMDGGWYLIRFSCREQIIRITAEARDEVFMISLMDIAKDIVYDSLK